MRKKNNYYLPYLVWFLGAFFFFVDYIVRVSSSVLAPTLMANFHANAFTIGGFASCFYYAYISMQIPVGILVDRFSPKWLLIMASLLCAISTLMFAEMNTIYTGFFSRFLMGFGASFAFVTTLKLISIWFQADKFAFLAGLTQAMGMLGAMIGQGPMAILYQGIGWRKVMYGFCGLFVMISLLVFLFINNKNNRLAHETTTEHRAISILDSIKLILTNSQSWLNCLFIGLLYAPSACFGEQWGASFLSLTQGISIKAAGQETGIMFIGLAIGCPVLGAISDRMQRRLLIMRMSVVVCFTLLCVIIYGQSFINREYLTQTTFTVILFIYGFFNSGIVVSYALASEINPRQIAGTALGITNMASVIVGATMIPIVGFILDKFWSGAMFNDMCVFTVNDYQIAFAALPIGLIIAFFVSFFQKETYCQSQDIPLKAFSKEAITTNQN